MDQILHITRREMLKTATCGFGGLALTGMNFGKAASSNSLVPKTALFPQRAKRVIFIFMAGGPSHVDTFDYKPELFAKMESKLILLEYDKYLWKSKQTDFDENPSGSSRGMASADNMYPLYFQT